MRHALLIAGIAGVFLTATPAVAETGPVAVDDQAEAGSDTIQIYVLDNDTDPDENLDPTSLALVTEPSKGKATVISTGRPRIKYTQQPGETGEDRFTYRVCDTANLCATATVTITLPSTTTTSTTSTTIPTTTTTLAPSTSATDEASTEGSTPPPSSTTTTPLQAAQTTTTELGTDAAGQAVLSSPTTDTARFGDRQSVGLAASMAMLYEAGAETVRIAAVPAVMGAGIAGFLASGLPKDIIAAILGWLAGRRKQKDPFQDSDKQLI